MKLISLEKSSATIGLFVTFVLATTMPNLVLAADDIKERLQQCVSIDDSTARLVCYDELGGRQNSIPVIADVAIASDVPAAPAPAKPAPASVQGGLPDWDKDTSVVTEVQRCTKDSNNKYLFHLADGQVWRQVSSKRLFFRDCNFGVTISKDLFGYKMVQDGEKSSIRISRLR